MFVTPSIRGWHKGLAFKKHGSSSESPRQGVAVCRAHSAPRAQALRSLETGLDGWSLPRGWKRMTRQQLEYGLRVPNPERMLVLKQARLPVRQSSIMRVPSPERMLVLKQARLPA